MKRGIMKFVFLCFYCFMLVLAACGEKKEHDTPKQDMTQRQIQREASSLKYGYDGEFGVYGIADTASAYNGTTLLARATAIKIIEKDPGPNQIEVEETHYSPTGEIAYQGKLRIRFGFSGGFVEEEIPISGRKDTSYFNGWPSGV